MKIEEILLQFGDLPVDVRARAYEQLIRNLHEEAARAFVDDQEIRTFARSILADHQSGRVA
jgi:hypothetical protein